MSQAEDGPAWVSIREAFEKAIELPHVERDEFLGSLRLEAPALAQRVAELLAAAIGPGLQPDRPGPMELIARELSVPVLDLSANRIGRYTVVRSVGLGGMGVVYEAHDPALDRLVAIKVIHAAALTERTRRRFEDEATILARLRHPGIAQVYECGWLDPPQGSTERLPYIVLELVTGGTPLTDYAAGLRLGLWEIVDLFLVVLDAVQHAHQRGVIHRDLKPANILVDGTGQPKVIDFGIAGSSGAGRASSVSGLAGGTLRYMSPEQCDAMYPGGTGEPATDADARSDVYSLGVVLYEMIEGRSPYPSFGAGSLGGLVEEVRSARIARPCLGAVPDRATRRDLSSVLHKALAHDSASRYSSVSGLAEDLQRLKRREPVLAGPRSFAHDARLFARRNRTQVISALAVVLALLVGAVSAAVGLVRARHAQQLAQAETARAHRVADFFSRTINSTRAGVPARQDEAPLVFWLQGRMNWTPARPGGEGARVPDVLRAAAARLPQELADDPLVFAQIAYELAGVMGDLYLLPEAQQLARRSLEIRREVLGSGDEDTIRSLALYGLVLESGQEQIRCLSDALASAESALGRADPRIHALRCRFCEALDDAGEHTRAFEEARSNIEIARTEFGADSIECWESRRLYGGLLARRADQASLQEGIAEQEEALAAFERLTRGESDRTAIGYSTLADAYSRVDMARSEPLRRKALEIFERVSGPASIAAYEARSALYNVLLRQRKLPEAEAVAREQARYARDALGDEAYSTVKAKARLARVLVWQHKDLDQAEALARQASQDSLAYDEKAPWGNWSAYFRALWAEAIRLEGKPAVAEQRVRELLRARAGINGEGWTDGMLYVVLAEALIDQDHPQEARQAIDEARFQLAKLNDPGFPINLTVQEVAARLERGAAHTVAEPR